MIIKLGIKINSDIKILISTVFTAVKLIKKCNGTVNKILPE